MKKKYHNCIQPNFMLLDKLEDKEKRQLIESICIEESILNGDVKAILDQIKK
ncbi:hypothetical protein [Crassaminicella thermophila]|uniref:hypothetical protein n=1 Tax=Crassaminicella thermophila TaxID=2599308 RepID=UPI00143CC259|nr:hypothetical protein [Crassaminicella thermophila]